MNLQDKRPPTVRDIAKLAGVSITTVSSALSRTGRVSEKLRLKIRKIAADLNYHPQVAAQLMRSNKTGQIGLVLCVSPEEASNSPVWMAIQVAFVKACEQDSIPYHIEFYDPDEADTFDGPRQLMGRLVDGSLVCGFSDSPIGAWFAEQADFPWVGLLDSAGHSVIPDRADGILEAVKHLAAIGHRRIAFGYGPTKYSVHRLGLEGYHRAISEFGLDIMPDELVQEFPLLNPRKDAEAFGKWARHLLAEKNRPTAVICGGMIIAREVIYETLLAGLSIPKDLSIIAGGISFDAQKSRPWVSTFETNYNELTEQAFNMLRRLIEKDHIETPHLLIRPRIVVRDTVCPPSSSHNPLARFAGNETR